MGLNCSDGSAGPIFSQPWWLDAVAPGSWDQVIVEKGGDVLARLPYVIKRRFGFNLLVMPRLTQTLGPWFAPHQAKYVTQLSRQHEFMTALIEQLPPFDYFSQRFHHSVTNWLPFYWQGFSQTTRYTYLIEDLDDLDAVWGETRDNVRRAVRKAQKKLAVRTDLGLETFLDLNAMTFERQGLSLPYSRELVARLDQACQARHCRQIFFAEDARGRVHASAYLVWDEQTAYYLMGGSDPELRNSGASSLLLWEAIRFAATVSRTFDFEGSMKRSIERIFRAFGARQMPYHEVTKINSVRLRAGLALTGPLAARLGRRLFLYG